MKLPGVLQGGHARSVVTWQCTGLTKTAYKKCGYLAVYRSDKEGVQEVCLPGSV